MSSSIDDVLALERELQSPQCRRNLARLDELLADDFEEVGASGRIWNRDDTLHSLTAESSDSAPIAMHGLHGRVVTADLIVVRWDSERAGRHARRTSLWRYDPSGWRLVHHQGTLITA